MNNPSSSSWVGSTSEWSLSSGREGPDSEGAGSVVSSTEVVKAVVLWKRDL